MGSIFIATATEAATLVSDQVLTELIKSTPFGAVCVIVLFIMWRLYAGSLKHLREVHKDSIKEIREAHALAYKRIEDRA